MKNKLSLVAIILSSFFFLNCGSSTVEQQETEQDTENQEFKERVELSKIIQTTPYTRYFLFKGDNLISVKEGLKWWSTTYKIDWTVKESKYKDWVLVKMIKEDIGAEVSDFHNMSSLFLIRLLSLAARIFARKRSCSFTSQSSSSLAARQKICHVRSSSTLFFSISNS